MALPPLPIPIPAATIDKSTALTAVLDCIMAVITAPINISTIGSINEGLMAVPNMVFIISLFLK